MIKELLEVCGKKLLWVGYDPKDELYDMVFEGNLVLRFPEFVPVHGPDYIKKVLAERLADAQNTLALSELTRPDAEDEALAEQLEEDVAVAIGEAYAITLVNAHCPGAIPDPSDVLNLIPKGDLPHVGQEATQAPEVAQLDPTPIQCEEAGAQVQGSTEPGSGGHSGGDAAPGQVGGDACASSGLPPE